MKVEVLKPFRARSKGEIVQHNPGEKIQIRVDKVPPLLNAGVIRLLEPLDKAEEPIAAKIYSHILQDTIWVAFDSTFTGDADGILVYSIEEIRMMRGADEHTMRMLHACKKELGGVLVKGGKS